MASAACRAALNTHCNYYRYTANKSSKPYHSCKHCL